MRNKSRHFIFAIILIFIILLIFLYFNYKNNLVLEKKEIYAKVIIGEKYGFDINSSALIFGMIVPGMNSAKREIILTNNYEREVIVDISFNGEIGDFLKVSKNNFILKPNESSNVSFIVFAPFESEFGLYDGNVTVLIRKSYEI